MMMKQLLRHTTSLLRTALLFGAIAFVNIPQTQAQTADQLAEMPNPFETIDDPNTVINNGQYYYIQFYYNGPISYLTDCGLSKKALATDFMPSNNRLWTLESAGNGQFKLRCKDGNYLGFGRFDGQDRYGGVNNSGDAVVFSFDQFKGGYYIKKVSDDSPLCRYNNQEWSDFPWQDARDSHKYAGHMRLVKLKSTNVAYIIYYRGEEETDHAGNTNADAASSRHYLTYSGLDAVPDNWNTHDGWTALGNTQSVITNGDLDTSNDYSSFVLRTNGYNQQAPIGGGVSGNGIAITSGAGQANAWDTQFIIKANEPLPEGTRFRVQFNCAATNTVEIGTQAHGEPGTYHYWNAIGNVTFGGGSVVERFGTVTADMAREDGMLSIAFNLGMTGNQPATTFYIDNIIFEVLRTSDVSNRTSILNTNDAWKLPTASAYHQDGLWELEPAANDGEFYIKKYGSTNEYINCWPLQSGVSGYNIMGVKDELYGRYILDDPNANRYTRVQNANNYTSTALTSNDFYRWNYDTSNPANSTPNGLAGAEQHYGQELGQLGLVIGYGNVSYQVYADLTGYAMMVIEGTPGMQLRVSLNRLSGNGDGGEITLLTPVIGDDGKAVIDLTALPYPYIHLNAIKNGYGINGTVTGITLLSSNSSNNNFMSHNNTGDHEGKMVMQYGNGNNNILFGFRPVEVPVPNKDNYYQAILQLKSNTNQMVDYNGGATGYSEDPASRRTFQVEQVDDYGHFRLKTPNGEYLRPYPNPGGVTAPNDPTDADVISNITLVIEKFNLIWVFIDPNITPKEIRVNHYVRHKESYLRTYAEVIADQVGLRRQGLSTDVDSDWRNLTDDLDGFTQKVNHFEITHYVKKGSSRVIEFPTVLNRNNDHIFFQRFYHYGEVDEEMDLDKLKDHVSLDTRDDGNVQYFLYNNGMVTGQKLDWRTYDSNTETYSDIADGGMARNEQRRFNFTNSDGESFTVAVDVSRYSDLEYLNNPDHLDGDLREPSLTMRYLFYMNDANDMAKKLTACPEGSDNWLEKKDFHFGRTQVPYTRFKKVGYRGEFLGIRHIFSDYWVYDDPNLITKDADGNVVVNTSYINSTYGTQANIDDFLNQHLVSAVNDNMSGKIVVEVDDPNNTGIRLGGYNPNIDLKAQGAEANEGNDDDYEGFYLYDLMAPNVKHEYGNSRFVVFRYPDGNIVNSYGPQNPAYIKVYLKNGETKYQIAQYTLYFDANMATRPWTEIKNGTVYANANMNHVKGTTRDPNSLRARAGHPIAKVTFDFPKNTTYHYPTSDDCPHTDGITKHDGGNWGANGMIDNSSPIPLTFGHTNYAFDGDGCNWGSYTLVTQKSTVWGNQKKVLPADDNVYGYGRWGTNPGDTIAVDEGMQKAFMYIDASEQPGDICAVDFEGEFCSSDNLMCTGWISGSNKILNDDRCPGSITLTVKGEDVHGNTNTIYRFCPGQIYELNNGYGDDGNGNATEEEGTQGIDGNGNNATHVVWQQFYFEFSTDQKYERYWLEVNNNCVSSNGGDFMLDNVEVYTVVPEVEPEINTPLCVSSKDGVTVTEMRLLKLKINYGKLKESRTLDSNGTAEEGFAFLDKYKFLEVFKDKLEHLPHPAIQELGLESFDFANMTLDELAIAIEEGKLASINLAALQREHDPQHPAYKAYQEAFDAAILGDKSTWHSDRPGENMNASILYFRWSTNTTNPDAPYYMHPYSFADAANKKYAVFLENVNGEEYVVMNGNYPELNWKTNTDYYIINTNETYESMKPFVVFNLCSECTKASTFRIDSPYNVLGLESSESTNDYVVCEGQIPTIGLELKGYTLKGDEVDMTGLNYDWWLGHKSEEQAEPGPGAGDPGAGGPGAGGPGAGGPGAEEEDTGLATLKNYHAQHETFDGVDVYLDKALSTLRVHYPAITSLEGVVPRSNKEPFLTMPMIKYLKQVVAAGELVLHQTTISVPAEKASDDDPYFYVVACPIHDEAFSQALNPAADEYVAYFCDEPQGLRIKVGQKAPTLMTGFVPGEHGFGTYDYAFPEGTNPVLSIRLAKAAQFETVKNTVAEAADGAISNDVNHLWLPIRNAVTQTADGVIKKSDDDNVYLASSNDPTWDKKISKQMSKYGSLPVVGRIVRLEAINTSGGTNIAAQNDENRLCVYFTKDFEVREGYNYTLSLPFEEEGDVNTCDGTILINLKIVPDYEVWTGAAGNTDWNNDENWRRADGNTTISNAYYGDELYRANGAVNDEDSPLHEYVTNKANYYSSNKNSNKPSSDQILRKGFAPLYCTHILMKSDEWGNAPVLYDPLDYEKVAAHEFTNTPFPNLRETATPILKFDMQARRYDMWEDTYGEPADRGTKDGDLIAEMYQMNSCDEIAFQPGTELLDAHLLNYNTAWVEYQLDAKRWYLLGSPLQGTIAGEWYAPTGNSPQQKTTYYDAVKFGAGYDRYSPAIYQRSWDKAKAVLYEVGSTYSTADNPDDLQLDNDGTLPGSEQQGIWNGATWNTAGADEYLDRLGYKPLGNNKANVAIQGIWSNTYNDATVDYTKGGFSVMVMNHLKGNAGDVQAIVRLPKEDTMYDYYKFSEDGSDDGGTDTYLSDTQETNYDDVQTVLGRAKNRGRLKTDLLLPVSTQGTEGTASIYGDKRTITRIPIHEDALQTMNASYRNHTEAVSAGVSNLGYYLVENPFNCGLDMEAFFAANTGLEAKYWLLTATGQHLVQRAADGEWITSDGTSFGTGKEYPDPEDNTKTLKFYPYAVLAPGQGFFVQAKTAGESTTITFNKDMQVQSRFGVIDGEGSEFTVVVGQSQATKLMYDANNDGIPDTEVSPDNYEEGDLIMIDTDNDGTPDTPTPVMIVPQYQMNGDEYATDSEGNRIPVLEDIEATVTIYKYKKETLTIPDDPTTQDEDESETIDKTRPLRAPSRGVEASDLAGLVITAQRGNNRSSALVMKHDGASNDFLPSEDTETFITSDQKNVPTVYTLCGRLATTINSIHDFRCLPLGVESASDAPCTLTFKGVELLGDSVAFYDAVERKLTPLESGMTMTVSGQTQNRYYLVSSLIQEEAAEETHLQIFSKGLTVKVIASTAEPIVSVRCYDVGGSQVHNASPQTPEYSFNLSRAGVYLIKADTKNDHKVVKVIVR